MHPDQDVRLRRRGRRNDPRSKRVTASTRTSTGVRWDDIVSRVFGRIDPIAIGGEDYRRSEPNVDVYDRHTRFGGRSSPTASTCCAPTTGEQFIAEQVVIAAGSRAMVPPAILDCGVRYHTSDDNHADTGAAPAPGHRRRRLRGSRISRISSSALGVRITLVIRGGALLSAPG